MEDPEHLLPVNAARVPEPALRRRGGERQQVRSVAERPVQGTRGVQKPEVHRVASLLKRWLLGTHQGSVHPDHLPAYLDEFTFPFNRRTSRRRGLLFYRLLQQAVVTDPTTYKAIVGRDP